MAVNGSSASNYLQQASSPVSAYPISMCAWVRPTSVSTAQVAFRVELNSGTGDDGFAIKVKSNGAAAAFVGDSSGGNTSADATPICVINQWTFIVGVFLNATDRRCWKDGQGKGTGTSSMTPGAANRITVCTRGGASPSQQFLGDVAECAVWGYALSDGEASQGLYAAALRGQISQFRPDKLVWYRSLRSNYLREPGDVGSGYLAKTGTVKITQHPSLIVPRPRRLYLRSQVVASKMLRPRFQNMVA